MPCSPSYERVGQSPGKIVRVAPPASSAGAPAAGASSGASGERPAAASCAPAFLVQRYHAAIGAGVPRAALMELETKFSGQARQKFVSKDYEGALDLYAHCLALTERVQGSEEPEVRGTNLHNLASCLHHMGEFEAARSYYEQAHRVFSAQPAQDYLSSLIFHDVNQKRRDFVRERLIDINWGRKPGEDFLDASGTKRAHSELAELEARAPSADGADPGLRFRPEHLATVAAAQWTAEAPHAGGSALAQGNGYGRARCNPPLAASDGKAGVDDEAVAD